MKNIFIALVITIFAAQFAFAGKSVNGAGASFPYPVYSAWAFTYYKATKTKINYQSIGSGGGVRQIINRTVEFGASDAPVSPEKLAANNLLQFPAIIGGVVPIHNVKGIKAGQLKLQPNTLAGIFSGRIKKWNDPEIAEINPGLALPNENITIVHRSDGSGTTAIFTKYLAEVSPEWKKTVGTGKAVKWPVGIGGKGNEGVANYVKRVKNSIGYVEFAYAKNNKLSDIALKNKDGHYVTASFNSFKEAASFAKWDQSKGYYLWLVNAPGKGSWPIAGASFILLAKEKMVANQNAADFYKWCFANGDQLAEKLTYVPLPQNLKEDIMTYWKANGIK